MSATSKQPSSIPFMSVAVLVVAAVIVLLILTPSGVWRSTQDNAVYTGFDPNLLHIDRRGSGTSEGAVEVSARVIRLTAVAFSNPTIHLISSELDYNVKLDVHVIQAQGNALPLLVKVWNSRKRTEFSFLFGPPPDHQLTATTTVGNTTTRQEKLGPYDPAQPYRLELSLDRRSGALHTRFRPRDLPPEGVAVILEGAATESASRELHSVGIPGVEAGERHVFGGVVRLASGRGWYKLVLDWLDQDGRKVGSANDWRPSAEISGWTKREFTATAPRNAAFARMVLGAGPGTKYLMTDLYVRKGSGAGTNIVPNGDFRSGGAGWKIVGGNVRPEETLKVIRFSAPPRVTVATSREAPSLFLDLPVALTIASSAVSGWATTEVENYELRLPSQAALPARVRDARITILLTALLTASLVLCSARAPSWVIILKEKAFPFCTTQEQPVFQLQTLLILFGAFASFLLFNALLFNLGYHTYDLISGKIWAYVTTRYGVTDLYSLPSTITPAETWGGEPYAPAIFPYGPVMAYIFAGIGWICRLFLADPQGLRLDTFQLGLAIKSTNVVFALADGVLIYLILRRLQASRRTSSITAALFIFNPAVWFVMSVWGQTHTISLFFALAAIWSAEKGYLVSAWSALAAGALTRPQMLVPSLLLSLVFLRKFPLNKNAHAISWAIIFVFLALAPFTIAYGPSLPLDVLRGVARTQNPTNPEVGAYFYSSLHALNLWPLVSKWSRGVSGLDRFFFPSSDGLVGPLTYAALSNILVGSILLILGAAVLLKRGLNTNGGYLPVVALGTLTLLLFRTGIADHHFVLALPFVILSRPYLSPVAFGVILGTLTLNTLVSTFGDLGTAISRVGYLMPALYHENNPITRLFMDLMNADLAITLGSLENLGAFLWLAVSTSRRTLAEKPNCGAVGKESR